MYRDKYSTSKNPPYRVICGFRVFSTPLAWEQTFPEALVDTGSDVSILPASSFQLLINASDACHRYVIYDQIEVAGITGKQTDVPLFLLEFEMPEAGRIMEATFLMLGEHALIGRNILNRYRIVLDGTPDESTVPKLTVAHL